MRMFLMVLILLLLTGCDESYIKAVRTGTIFEECERQGKDTILTANPLDTAANTYLIAQCGRDKEDE